MTDKDNGNTAAEDIKYSPEDIFERLIANMKKYHPSKDFHVVEKAYKLSYEAHEGQVRKSGEPYIIHPLEVAIILSEIEMDKETITAGILHDVIEDTKYSFEDIERFFGAEIAHLVNGVTKLERINYSSLEEEQADNYRKMFLAMSNDIRVIIIKIADRLHNLRTLKFMTPEKQKEKAQETIDIYAPLAERLGITKIRYELEDLAFRYQKPDQYFDLKEKIQQKQSEREDVVDVLLEELSERFKDAGMYECAYSENIKNFEYKENLKLIVDSLRDTLKSRNLFEHKHKRLLEKPNVKGFYLEGRPKHFFSIHKKMVRQSKSLDQIYDLFAVRVIVSSIKDCYEIVGIVHEMYKPVPGRFKDYIALPKTSMYQSIHTTLIGPNGEPFEIQIRTWDMHRVCEYGVAAHWKYKEGISGVEDEDSSEKKLTWLRQMLDLQRDMSDNREYLDALKFDLDVYRDSVFCFTPKGDVKNLIAGSTPIDFAYSIHTAVGNKMTGAKVNGKIVPLEHVLETGDRIEILTSQNARPNRDWLRIAKTNSARSKISQWLRLSNREENVAIGKSLLEKCAKRKNVSISEITTPESTKMILTKFNMPDWDAVCAAVGHGGLKEGQIINRMYEEYLIQRGKNEPSKTIEEIQNEISENKKKERTAKSGIFIKGIGDTSVRYSKCCSPVPGDEVVAFVTRGRGVSLHRTDCVNIINITETEKARLLPAEWMMPDRAIVKNSYRAELAVVGENRINYFADVCRALTDEKITMLEISAKKVDDLDHMHIAILVESKEQLEMIRSKIMKIKTTHSVTRVST